MGKWAYPSLSGGKFKTCKNWSFELKWRKNNFLPFKIPSRGNYSIYVFNIWFIQSICCWFWFWGHFSSFLNEGKFSGILPHPLLPHLLPTHPVPVVAEFAVFVIVIISEALHGCCCDDVVEEEEEQEAECGGVPIVVPPAPSYNDGGEYNVVVGQAAMMPFDA